MIQIDDAGSGSLVGGTCIGVIRKNTEEFYYETIPISLFNKENFKNKLYIYYTTEIVKNALEKLKVSKKELISICQGYVFEDTRKYLDRHNYNFNSEKIGDPLQNIIEKTFEDYAISLGLWKEFLTYTRYPFHFHHLLKWVYADYNNRVKLCKTGWQSWEKFGDLKPQVYYDKILNSKYLCLKCGNKIENNSSVKIIKFTSNRTHYVYTHKNC